MPMRPPRSSPPDTGPRSVPGPSPSPFRDVGPQPAINPVEPPAAPIPDEYGGFGPKSWNSSEDQSAPADDRDAEDRPRDARAEEPDDPDGRPPAQPTVSRAGSLHSSHYVQTPWQRPAVPAGSATAPDPSRNLPPRR